MGWLRVVGPLGEPAPLSCESRAHRRVAMLRHGLGYAAVGLAAFLSALFFYSSFVSAVPLPLAILGWLLLLPAAYCFYRLIVLHLDEEEAAGDAT